MRILCLLVLYLAAVGLTACAPPVTTDVTPVASFAEYTSAEQKKMAQDYAALPPTSSMRRVVNECGDLRQEIRAGKLVTAHP